MRHRGRGPLNLSVIPSRPRAAARGGVVPACTLSRIFKAYFGSDDERDERVRRKLVETLYTHPMSLLVGARCAAWSPAGPPRRSAATLVIAAGAALLTAVGATRVALAYWIAWPAALARHPHARADLRDRRIQLRAALGPGDRGDAAAPRPRQHRRADDHVRGRLRHRHLGRATPAGRFIAATQLLLTVMPVVAASPVGRLALADRARRAVDRDDRGDVLDHHERVRDLPRADHRRRGERADGREDAQPRAQRHRHRARQPRRAQARLRRAAAHAARGPQAGDVLDRPRPVQGDQRHAGPHGRRQGADRGRQPAARRRARRAPRWRASAATSSSSRPTWPTARTASCSRACSPTRSPAPGAARRPADRHRGLDGRRAAARRRGGLRHPAAGCRPRARTMPRSAAGTRSASSTPR